MSLEETKSHKDPQEALQVILQPVQQVKQVLLKKSRKGEMEKHTETGWISASPWIITRLTEA